MLIPGYAYVRVNSVLFSGIAGFVSEKACFRDGFADCFAASFIVLIAAAGSGP